LGIWPAPWLASPIRYYYLALAACGAGLAALAAADRAPFGLTLRAARDHARRAEAVGIDVRAHQWLAFVVAGFFGGLAGGTFAFLKGSVFPELLAVPVSVEPLVMVLLGGVHSLAGAPLGAALYKLLDTVVTRYTEYWQLVLGVILVVLVLVFPRALPPPAIWRLGSSRTFQVTATFATLTVLESVQVARLSHAGRSRALLIPAARLEVAPSRALLAQVGLIEQAARPAAVLAYGDL